MRPFCPAFRFGSDGYVTGPGWYIDDVHVTPQSGTEGWVSLHGDGGNTPTGALSQLSLDFSTAGFAPAETRAAGLKVTANDPTAPVQVVPVILHNLTRSLEVVQPDHGSIAPTGVLHMLRGDTTNLTVTADRYFHIAALLTKGFKPLVSSNPSNCAGKNDGGCHGKNCRAANRSLDFGLVDADTGKGTALHSERPVTVLVGSSSRLDVPCSIPV